MALSSRRGLRSAGGKRRECLHLIVRTSWDSLSAHFAKDGGKSDAIRKAKDSSRAALPSPSKENRSKPHVESAKPVLGRLGKEMERPVEKKSLRPALGEKKTVAGEDKGLGPVLSEKKTVLGEKKSSETKLGEKKDSSGTKLGEKKDSSGTKLGKKKDGPLSTSGERRSSGTKLGEKRNRSIVDEKKVSDNKRVVSSKESGRVSREANGKSDRKNGKENSAQVDEALLREKKLADATKEYRSSVKNSVERRSEKKSAERRSHQPDGKSADSSRNDAGKSPGEERSNQPDGKTTDSSSNDAGKPPSEETAVQRLQKEAVTARDRAARSKLEELSDANKRFKAELTSERRWRKWEGVKQEFKLEEDDWKAWGRDRRDSYRRERARLEQQRDGGEYRSVESAAASKEKLEEMRAVESLKHRRELFYSQPSCVNTFELGDALRECARTRNLAEGRSIHARLAEGFYDRHTYLGNLLIQMYGNCGKIEEARSVFNMLDEKNVFSWNIMQAAFIQNGFVLGARHIFDANPDRSVVSWNSMIAAYAHRGMLDEAKSLFESMPVKNIVSWTGMLQAFARSGSVEDAKRVFDRMGDKDPVTWNTMLSAFASKGMIAEAKSLFVEMPLRDRVSWTAMVTAHSQAGQGKEAIRYYYQMVLEGIQPNRVTCLTVLHACAELKNLKVARAFHELFVENGLEVDMTIGTALVDMYAKCGNLHQAQMVFDRMPDRDVVTWTAMTTAYASAGKFDAAQGLFLAMPTKNVISHNTMLGALINAGKLDEARENFEQMSEKNWASWNWMILGHARSGLGKEALRLFGLMDLEGFYADRSTFASALTACSSIPAPVQGKLLHAEIMESGGLEDDAVLTTALLDMYASCGGLEAAERLFREMAFKDEVAWTAMVAGYVRNDHDEKAVEFFREMLASGLSPGAVTFLHLFSACSHLGLVEECRWYFVVMLEDYKVAAELDHYLCLVDLLGRGGQLDRAEELIETMPFQPVAGAWRTLLSACKTHNDKERAERAAKKNSELEPGCGSPYLILSNLNAEAGNAKVEDGKMIAGTRPEGSNFDRSGGIQARNQEEQRRDPEEERWKEGKMVASNFDRSGGIPARNQGGWEDQSRAPKEERRREDEMTSKSQPEEQRERIQLEKVNFDRSGGIPARNQGSWDDKRRALEEERWSNSQPEEQKERIQIEKSLDQLSSTMEELSSSSSSSLGRRSSERNERWSRRNSSSEWPDVEFPPDDRNGFVEDGYVQRRGIFGEYQRSQGKDKDRYYDPPTSQGDNRAQDDDDLWREEESWDRPSEELVDRVAPGKTSMDLNRWKGERDDYYQLRQQALRSQSSSSSHYSLVSQGSYVRSSAMKETEFFYNRKESKELQEQDFYEPEYGYKW